MSVLEEIRKIITITDTGETVLTFNSKTWNVFKKTEEVRRFVFPHYEVVAQENDTKDKLFEPTPLQLRIALDINQVIVTKSSGDSIICNNAGQIQVIRLNKQSIKYMMEAQVKGKADANT